MIDSGADVNVLTEADWGLVSNQTKKEMFLFNLNMDPETNVRSYASTSSLQIFCTLAKLKPDTFAEFVMVKGGQRSLLGLRTAIEMKLLAIGLFTATSSTTQEFPSIPAIEISFDVDEFVFPIRHAYVSIPIHFRERAAQVHATIWNNRTSVGSTALDFGNERGSQRQDGLQLNCQHEGTQQGDPKTISSDAKSR